MRGRRFIPNVFFGKFLARLYILILLLVILFPLVWMFSLSFRTGGGLAESRFLIFPVVLDHH